MSLFGIFKKKSVGSEVSQPIIAEPQKENEMTQDSKRGVVRTITYVTGLPIDVVYDCIGHDNDEKGFNDAMVSLDATYQETGKNLIKNDMNKVIDQTILKYNDGIKELDSMIAYNESMGLMVSVTNLKTRKDVYLSHIEEMNGMKKQLDDLTTTTMNSIRSYERGFMRGITAKTELVLNGNE